MRLFNGKFNAEVARQAPSSAFESAGVLSSKKKQPNFEVGVARKTANDGPVALRPNMKDATWSEPQTWLAMAENDLHVWLANVPAARAHLAEFMAVLAPEERERAARFRFEQHRERSQIARGMLRLLLARYIEQEAGALRFTYNAHGKPELPGAGVHFNTSHSGDYVVVGFTRTGAVGVDIEQVRGDIARRDEIAQRHFAPGEQAQLSALPERERARAFFDLWTRKEAFVKARGDGLFSGLDQFETLLAEPRVLTVRGAPAADWWMSELPAVADYAGAVVVNAAVCQAHFWKWNHPL
jgi:4'-phosphopantetheinyl transferase